MCYVDRASTVMIRATKLECTNTSSSSIIRIYNKTSINSRNKNYFEIVTSCHEINIYSEELKFGLRRPSPWCFIKISLLTNCEMFSLFHSARPRRTRTTMRTTATLNWVPMPRLGWGVASTSPVLQITPAPSWHSLAFLIDWDDETDLNVTVCGGDGPAVLQSVLSSPAVEDDEVSGHWAKLGLLGGLASLVAEAPAHCPRLLLPPPVVTHWSGLKY